MRAAAVHLVATHPFPEFREKLVPLLDDDKAFGALTRRRGLHQTAAPNEEAAGAVRGRDSLTAYYGPYPNNSP